MVAGAVLVLAGCGDELERGEAVTAFAAAHPEASTVEATCVVDALIEGYGLDGLEDELDRPVSSAEFSEAQYRAMFACGLRDDVRVQLVEQLRAQGLDDEQASCVAEDLTGRLDEADLEVLLSGELTDPFFDKYFDAVAGCDALPPS